MLRIPVKRCECGRVTNPVTTDVVNDAWVKHGVVYFEFICSQCANKNVVNMKWSDSIFNVFKR